MLRAHQPTYILPLWHLFSPNSQPSSPTQESVRLFGTKLNNVETKYQLSFKSKLWQNVLGTPADLLIDTGHPAGLESSVWLQF